MKCDGVPKRPLVNAVEIGAHRRRRRRLSARFDVRRRQTVDVSACKGDGRDRRCRSDKPKSLHAHHAVGHRVRKCARGATHRWLAEFEPACVARRLRRNLAISPHGRPCGRSRHSRRCRRQPTLHGVAHAERVEIRDVKSVGVSAASPDDDRNAHVNEDIDVTAVQTNGPGRVQHEGVARGIRQTLRRYERRRRVRRVKRTADAEIATAEVEPRGRPHGRRIRPRRRDVDGDGSAVVVLHRSDVRHRVVGAAVQNDGPVTRRRAHGDRSPRDGRRDRAQSRPTEASPQTRRERTKFRAKPGFI